MKKLLLLLVSVVLLLSLCACSVANEPYTVKEGWRTLEINPGAGTITHKEDVFHYDISGNPYGYTVTFTYPDGSTYFVKHEERNSGAYRTSGHSEDYDSMRYVSGPTLYDVLEDELPEPLFPGNPALGFLKILSGVLCLIFPRIFWWLLIGWLLNDAEPAKYTLIVFRVFGALGIASGLITCFVSEFSFLGIIFGLIASLLF